jgi:uncharacterized protein
MTHLQGIRILLSGSIPDSSTESQTQGILTFVEQFAKEVLQQGGTLVHGSHPRFIAPLRAAAVPFVRDGGSRDRLTLVRASRHDESGELETRIATQREWAVVEIIPPGDLERGEKLVPMREWMAERCDIVVAVGGKWSDTNMARAGVPKELENMLARGKPGFVVAGFGGAVASYLRDDTRLVSRLSNGWTDQQNSAIAESTEISVLVKEIIDQVKRLPLRRTGTSTGRLFRILALDGGGIRGAFTAAVLAKWAEMLGEDGGHSLIKHFDLVAGTSTGAILAIGLGLGLSPLEILTFYRNKGASIFPSDRGLRHWLKSKHDALTLQEILTEIFHEKKLSAESICRLVIPTVRAQRGQAEVIVTAHSPDRTGFREYTAVQAALASAAAPTYFDEAYVKTEIANEVYLDGGVWANNPVLPAIAEAVRFLGSPIDRIDILSVGTLGNEMDFSNSLGKGKAGWAASSADLFFAAQESAALNLANGLLSRSRHLRINQLTPVEIKLDDTDALDDMAKRGSDAGRDSFDIVRSRFLDGIHAADWRASTGT